jgi:hypothetical protein
MPGNKRPRKAYSMKRAHVDALAGHRAIHRIAVRQSTTPMDAAQVRDLAIGYHSALDAIRRGAGCWDDVNTLALACNVALVLADAGIGADWCDKVKDAQVALVSLEARASSLRGRYVLTGGELQTLRALLDLHDAQLESDDCTQGVMVQALTEIRRRMEAGNVVQVGVNGAGEEAAAA